MYITGAKESMQHGDDFETLRVQVEGKEISVYVVCSINGASVVSRSHLPDATVCIMRTEEVESVLLKSLSIIRADCYLLVMCGDRDVFLKVLSILGATPRIGFFIA